MDETCVVGNLILLLNSPGKIIVDHIKNNVSKTQRIFQKLSGIFTEKKLILEGLGPKKIKVTERESVITYTRRKNGRKVRLYPRKLESSS